MLDDLRNTASNSSFLEDELIPSEEEIRARRNKPKKNFLGMTAPQRFLLSFMLLLMTSVFGLLVLLISGRIYLP
jgi:hypothetical protein